MADFWNGDRKAKLVKLIDEEGMSCGQAAAVIGCTRNGVVGILHRMGHKRPKKAKPGPKVRAVTPLKPTVPQPIANAVARKRVGPAPASQPKPPKFVASKCFQVGERVTVPIWDLGVTDCKWPYDPIEDGELVTYCGEETGDAACSFCPAHSQMAYNPQASRISTRGVRS